MGWICPSGLSPRPRSAWVCNVDRESLPADLLQSGPFGSVVLWAVLEDFRDPFEVLRRLTVLIRPGTKLLINTANAEGMTHWVLGSHWEGHFDWTHLGIDKVSVRSLREWLQELQWRIEWITTEGVWNGDADPTCATLREWWAADARFRRLLKEREIGDFLRCVAVKL